jgi:iron complex outermembrane receptor protein
MGRPARISRLDGLALLAAGCFAVVHSPAEAQETQDRPAERAPSPSGLDTIVVTARRWAESLQRAPVSVVSLSDEDLEARSVTNLRTLQNFVPNLTFAASQNVGEAAGNAFIRGIGQEDFAAGAEPGVGFYLDGVYIARSNGTLTNVVDVARIEVLRGPQGTLYGRNTIGGAINLISVMPRPGRERRFGLILGNHDRIELRGTANEPLSDRIFLRLSIGLVRRDGYLRRLPPPVPPGAIELVNGAPPDRRPEGDERSAAARVQLRWLLGDTLTADVSLDGARRRSRQGATHVDAIDPRFGIFPTLNRLIREGRLPGPEITADTSPDSLLESYAGGANFIDQHFWGASAVIAQELGAATLRFIAAYRGQRNRLRTDLDGLYFNISESGIPVDQHQFSAELQLNGTAGALTYAAGLFAFREKADVLPSGGIMNEILYTCGCFLAPGPLPQFTTAPRQIGSDSYAGYFQGTYRIGEVVSVTLGGRFSHERKRVDGQTFRLDADLQPTDMLVATGSNRDSWNSFTYRAGLEVQARPDLMVFGSVARGFKSGGFNVRPVTGLPNLGLASFAPETALTYEIGLRSEWLDRRLRLNATLFHTDYRNIQLRQQALVGGVAATLIENAARARIRGAEVELTAVPAAGLTLGIAYGHLDPRYLDVGRVPGLTLASRFQRTPSHAFTASANYELARSWGTVALHADYSYRSAEQFQITAAVNDQAGYGLIGARLTLRPRDERWSFALFGTNLADVHYRTAGRGTLIAQTGIAYSSIGLPRQLGIRIATRF